MVRYLCLAALIALLGCTNTMMAPTRTFTLDLDRDDPAGLFVINLQEEEQATIRESFTVPVSESHLNIDKAYLRNARLIFTHRGQPIVNGEPTDHDTRLHFWLVRRDENTLCFYIGTREQFVSLDRSRPHTIGPNVIQL